MERYWKSISAKSNRCLRPDGIPVTVVLGVVAALVVLADEEDLGTTRGRVGRGVRDVAVGRLVDIEARARIGGAARVAAGGASANIADDGLIVVGRRHHGATRISAAGVARVAAGAASAAIGHGLLEVIGDVDVGRLADLVVRGVLLGRVSVGDEDAAAHQLAPLAELAHARFLRRMQQ